MHHTTNLIILETILFLYGQNESNYYTCPLKLLSECYI